MIYTVRNHMYHKYNIDKNKSLLYRKNFLERQRQKLMISNFNRINAGKITGKNIGDNLNELNEVERLILWVDCELQQKKSEQDLHCDEHLESCSLTDAYVSTNLN